MARYLKLRMAYALASVGVVGLGLLWRSQLLHLSPFMRKYGGDALWAVLVFCLVRFCRTSGRTVAAAGVAFAIAVVVELSQLYHAPWIETIRGSRFGRLAVGSTFNGPDIAAYALGIVLAALADRFCRTARPSTGESGGRE